MDKCTQCGHSWHGLSCIVEYHVLDTGGHGLKAVVCNCPSQFKEK